MRYFFKEIMACQIMAAYILDIIFGDPYWFPHPVRIIGMAIERWENILRKVNLDLRFLGVFLSLSITIATFASIYFFIYICNSIHPLLGSAMGCFFIYTSLSIKSLGRESRKVYDSLKARDLREARNNLSMIVGRDTKDLNEEEIIKATVETVAENAVDGVIAPLFYACLGGASLALTYKTVNTLDSMVGYKNEQYKEFGWFSAKLDDAANWIPARLSAIFIPLAALMLRMSFKRTVKTIIKDGDKSPSPNAGIPEAGFAGALGIQLGGKNYYGGIESNRSIIGIQNTFKEKKDILKAIRLMQVVSLLFVVVASMLRMAIKGIY